MAGVKRKIDASQGSAAAVSGGNSTTLGAAHSTTNSTADDASHVRVTRSLRSSRDVRATQNDARNHSNASAMSGGSGSNNSHHSNSNNTTYKPNPNRPSRIITLSTRVARANTAAREREQAARDQALRENVTRETRNTRTRAGTSWPSQPVEGVVAPVPETPRHKRVKRGSTVEETPRTTRQSARLKAHVPSTSTEDGIADIGLMPKPSESSPSATAAPSSRTRNKSRQWADSSNDTIHSGAANFITPAIPEAESPSPDRTTLNLVEDTKPLYEEPHLSPKLAIEESPKGTVVEDEKNGVSVPALSEADDSVNAPSTPSPPSSWKRRSPGHSQRNGADSENFLESPSKKPKLEEGESDRVLEQQSQPFTNGLNGRSESESLVKAATDSKADGQSRHTTEEIEGSTPEIVTEPTATRGFRGGRVRGRGRGGRSRGAARFAANKRGRGGTRSGRGRAGRQLDRSSDVEPDRSPSPSAATQRLRDRQRELDKAFKKVAAAQRLALAVLATQSERRIARDKNAHKDVPEFEEVNQQLQERLRQKKDVLRREFELKVEQENRLFQAYREVVEERFQTSARNIREEHLIASQGAYMTFVRGRRAAEDDEHTETDDSETEPERGPVVPPAREIFRGFNSSYVRVPSGAAAYERAWLGWDDFVQRAKVGEDIDPQMKEMCESGPFSGFTSDEIIDMLVKATGVVDVRTNATTAGETQPPVIHDIRPRALSALADIAAAETPRPPIAAAPRFPPAPPHRTILPQPALTHGPPEPRAFVLPPPTPQRQQPRRLLPAGQQIPPINEQLGLPDPFASMGGPPHLPPPPGSNFHRPPLPGYLTGHHAPSLYYPPPPPPPPPGPRPPY
ncbi:uncharacterized protein BO95DRAFT_282394 [Aspergillus brunneoviolaceus CBS 621.78]|uniref:Uncharacterized protein n=1 Tax=Aspergillus brunneoviolaceus CBS 621.78 TaxID=1450534 RepID=A0ACD1FV83_9EURO|nr:hypothetical protein BO95DRAFT_282394 [Aspergillus brunneoviolaceus CBS 621.78]RAH40883.1 hypothetical protein BO95DRAFT_282394 [Aspergillus brunneoviolaceus CBS 621.78]